MFKLMHLRFVNRSCMFVLLLAGLLRCFARAKSSCITLVFTLFLSMWLHVPIPVASYPAPFGGYLLFYITDPNHKTRYPKKGVGYEPLGTLQYLLLPHVCGQ